MEQMLSLFGKVHSILL